MKEGVCFKEGTILISSLFVTLLSSIRLKGSKINLYVGEDVYENPTKIVDSGVSVDRVSIDTIFTQIRSNMTGRLF